VLSNAVPVRCPPCYTATDIINWRIRTPHANRNKKKKTETTKKLLFFLTCNHEKNKMIFLIYSGMEILSKTVEVIFEMVKGDCVLTL